MRDETLGADEVYDRGVSNDDDLRINSAERFQKAEKSRLLLEEHSHCEVPAGCGGVVLRWVDPTAGLAIALSVRAPTPLFVYLDGERVDSARLMLGFGEHLLALHWPSVEELPPSEPSDDDDDPALDDDDLALDDEDDEPVPPAPPLLLCGAQLDQRGNDELPVLEPLLSRADGSWRATVRAPTGEAWRRDLAFDESDWAPLQSTTLSQVPEQSTWAYERLSTLGAVPLALPERPAGTLWLRKRFRLDEPG